MWQVIRPAVLLFLLMTLITGVVYPLLVTGVAWVAFPQQAGGSLIACDGKPVGSALIGQPFTEAKYFWPRPSATSPFPYNAAASSGSNLGPSNPHLYQAVRQRIAALRSTDPLNDVPVPVDLVTASGSGLDPHISIAAARYQVGRVSRARQVPQQQVQQLVEQYTEEPALWILGEPRVNVLMLNMALDERWGR